ncbi:MAG: hypothetical protein HYY17_05500 [Planctomycetes bacterium]|nr:hypothetical protein [Planctomycetota bacterium]
MTLARVLDGLLLLAILFLFFIPWGIWSLRRLARLNDETRRIASGRAGVKLGTGWGAFAKLVYERPEFRGEAIRVSEGTTWYSRFDAELNRPHPPLTLVGGSDRRPSKHYLEDIAAPILQRIRGLGEDWRIEVRDRRISVRIHEFLNPGRFAAFLDAAEALADALALPKTDGVEFLPSPDGASGLCQVCGLSFGGEAVACAVCGTRHHKECWEYLGRCSTYACKGTTFRS